MQYTFSYQRKGHYSDEFFKLVFKKNWKFQHKFKYEKKYLAVDKASQERPTYFYSLRFH